LTYIKGGVVALLGAVGRFGTIDSLIVNAIDLRSFATFLISRGRVRQEFWYENQKEIQKKLEEEETGKKSKDKKGNTEKDSKAKKNPKEVVVSSIVDEVKYNYEVIALPSLSSNPSVSDYEQMDPNHGPTYECWCELLNISSSDYHGLVSSATNLTCATSNMLPTDIVLALLQAGAQVRFICYRTNDFLNLLRLIFEGE
jgi:hypothetical protein